MKKYELTDITKTLRDGTVLHRIRALRDFVLVDDGAQIRKGDLGGWIEREDNLSQRNASWVFCEARVYGDATVRENAKVYNRASVYGKACVEGCASIYDHARVYASARIYGKASVYGNAEVFGAANVGDLALIHDNAKVYDDAQVYGDAIVCEDARICGDAFVNCNAEVCGDAEVRSWRDYAVFKNTWSSSRWFTYTRSNRKWCVGCFFGTGEELIAKAYKDSDLSGRCYEAIVRAQEAIDARIAKEARNESKEERQFKERGICRLHDRVPSP